MTAIIWLIVIAATIYLSWNIGNRAVSKIAGLTTVGFWLAWTLGLSSLVVGYAITGPLFIVQLGIIVVVLYLSLKMRRSKFFINKLKKDLKRLDNANLDSSIHNISNAEIKVLDTPKRHRKMLLETLDKAKKTIVIFSGWLTDYSVNAEFRDKLKKCLERDVDIVIAWGYKKSGSIGSENKNKAEKSMRDLQEWTSIKKTRGILETFYFPNHSKILICDDEYVVCGSYNWLSNARGYNAERSYVISDNKIVAEESKIIKKHIRNNLLK